MERLPLRRKQVSLSLLMTSLKATLNTSFHIKSWNGWLWEERRTLVLRKSYSNAGY